MKACKNIILSVMLFVFSCSVYGLSDSAVVNSITVYSNLTQSDADKWKFLSLGPLTTSAVGIGALYSIGKEGYDYANLLTNVFKNITYPYFIKKYEPSESTIITPTGKWIWAGIGVTGAGLALYKIVYPRVYNGMINAVRKYSALCDRLAVARQKYDTVDDFNTALKEPGNMVWVISNPIAKWYGFKNLINQAHVALLLLDQLQMHGFNSNEIQSLQEKIIVHKSNIEHNALFIASEIEQEKEKRSQEQTVQGKRAEIMGKQVAAQAKRIKNINDQWKMLKDFVETAHKYGPFGVTGLVGWKLYNWWNPQNDLPID